MNKTIILKTIKILTFIGNKGHKAVALLWNTVNKVQFRKLLSYC